jgi:hypothetical protein
MKHTGLPFEIVKGTEHFYIKSKKYPENYIVKSCGDNEESEANMQFIIIASNNHYELLEALKTMTSLVRIKYGNLDKKVYEEILKAEKLLSNAEKGI